MRNRRIVLHALCAGSLAVLAAPSARAASLQQVTANWTGGVTGLPSDVSMYAYVPDKVAANPPILTLIHFCGGSAQAVFGQAQGGGIVSAADQYGFIMVVPSNANSSGANGRCWDISSKATQTRDGGGDSHAVVQMVRYAISQYQANPNRVYSTGDSSGAMMTQLLLALYPDIYKAGSSFAGVPAGCANAFDAQGLCGLPAQSAQQWGDRARAMDPGYSGRRPRVQLVQGNADMTISFTNFGEAIKEWTNVLGLGTSPTSTQSNLTLGTHQATRQQWQNACGYVDLDALTSIGGDHGPSDALFVAQYVIPFLGLDQPGAVDPEVAQCGGDGGAAPGQDGGADAGGGQGADGGRASSSASTSSGGSAGTSTGAGTTATSTRGTGSAAGSTGGGSSGSSGSGTSRGDSSAPGSPSSGCNCALVRADSKTGGGLAVMTMGLLAATLRRRRGKTRGGGFGRMATSRRRPLPERRLRPPSRPR